MKESDLMDMNTVKSLQNVLEDGLFDLYREFISDTPLTLEKLLNAVANNDIAEIRSHAHYLKGSGGNIGAMAFFHACKTLEQEAKENSIQDVNKQVEQIKNLLDETIEYMNRQMDSA